MIIGSFTSRLELFEVGVRHDGCCTLYSHNSMRYASAQCVHGKIFNSKSKLEKNEDFNVTLLLLLSFLLLLMCNQVCNSAIG